MVVAIAVVVVGAAGGAAAVLLNKQPTGEQAVRAYFEQLALGDAAGALAHVLPPETGSYSNQPLLTNTGIARPATRPTGLRVVERAQSTLPDGDIEERVSITYTVGETEFSHTILARQQEKGQPFLLEKPFLELRVAGLDVWVNVYLINGVPIDPDWPGPFLAFPGVYSGTQEANALFPMDTAKATRDGTELPAPYRIEFERELAPGAQQAVQEAVNAFLDRCLLDHTMVPMTEDWDGQPTRCPFSLRGDAEVTVDWSIGRYPDIVAVPSDEGFVLVNVEVPGLVRYDLPEGWIDNEFEFRFMGLAFVYGGVVKISPSYG